MKKFTSSKQDNSNNFVEKENSLIKINLNFKETYTPLKGNSSVPPFINISFNSQGVIEVLTQSKI